MGQRRDFVERATKGESISALAREFGVSRQTGHKWLTRFQERGYDGLEERSRRPAATPLATAEDVVLGVLAERKKHPTWGPRKLAIVLGRTLGDASPSERTIARILKRAELVRTRKKRRPPNVVDRAPVVVTTAPNDTWTIDFKGWWLTRDGKRANPLTVRDGFSRLVLAVTLCLSTTDAVREVLTKLFRRHGVPLRMQMDNGTPFVSVRSPGGLSALSAWLMSLGVTIVRSRLGSPQDNGAHERMHRDMSSEVEALPANDRAAQQRALDRWRQDFNHVRPHEALKGKTPHEVYKPKDKRPFAPRHWRYPEGCETAVVYANGNLRVGGRSYFLGTALASYEVGIQYVSPTKCRIWFRDLDVGFLDLEPEVDDALYESARLSG
jgi:putative transposase